MKGENMRVQLPDAETDLMLPPFTGTSAILTERLRRVGRPLNTRCAGRGLCAGCTVELTYGTVTLADGRAVAAPAEIKACQVHTIPDGATTIRVPRRSLATHLPQVVTTFSANIPAAQSPLFVPEPGGRDHGFAIDIGTTTVVVALVDLNSGQIIAEESSFNRQIELGDDVVTRIQLAGDPARLEELREAIVTRTLDPLMRQVCATAGLSANRVAGAVLAGNTTMLHLLTGTDPSPMGIAPFRAPFTNERIIPAASLGLTGLPPDDPVHLLPGFSAFVGSDLVAGYVCSGLMNDTGPSLLLDIGTNGEILLQHGDRLLATATAAGPAFEGGRLVSGTRAIAGAVSHVAFNGPELSPQLTVIPGVPRLAGICGSAYVDFLASGRQHGLLSSHGRFNLPAWERFPADLRQQDANGRGLFLQAGEPASLVTEVDLAQLLQAKAAIAAGILCLLGRMGLQPSDVRRLYLAGGFGLHLHIPNAIACGLLPGFEPAQVDVVGNTSLGGAWLAMIDDSLWREMIGVRAGAEIVELNLEPDFEDQFIDQLTLP